MFRNGRAGSFIGLVGLLASFAGCSGSSVDPNGCTYAGEHRAAGESFKDQDGCNTCTCDETGQVSCTLLLCAPASGCDYAGEHHEAGASFPSEDGCNQCQCQTDGEVACTAKDCAEGCTYAGEHRGAGESFKDEDGCNTCTCDEAGQVSCTLNPCAPASGGCDFEGQHHETGVWFPYGDGCNQCQCQSDGDWACTAVGCDSSCKSVRPELAQELAKVQSCSTADDCGQPIPDVGCGCTGALVARKDADLDRYLELQTKAEAARCMPVSFSQCDCPAADGFACINQRCTWNYTTTEGEPRPTCERRIGSRLCVRGTPTADGEVLEEGDTLTVTVGAEGCFSSTCTQVQDAECAISKGDGFEVAASFCVADTSEPEQGCTDDCGYVHADCSFGQGLLAGEHQVKLGSVVVGFQVPTKLPFGGLCADAVE